MSSILCTNDYFDINSCSTWGDHSVFPWSLKSSTCCSDGLTICLALSSAFLFRFAWRGGLSSHKVYTRLLSQMASSHFFFYKVHSPRIWIFYFTGFSSVSDLDSLSRATSRSWGSFWLLNVSDVLEGVPKWYGETCGHFWRDLVWQSVPISCQYPSGWQVASILQPRCPWCGLMGFLFLVSLCQRGSKIIGGTDPCLQAMSWKVFSLPYCFIFLWQRRSWWSLFPALQLDFFDIIISS